MPLIYVTGCAGSGKTTVKSELIKLGYEAHHEDDPDIGAAHNRLTNQPVKVPLADQRTEKWFSEHEWRVFPDTLTKLKDQSSGKFIFLCGNIASEQQLREVFDRTIFLDIDEGTMRTRLAARQGNDFGKTEAEVQMILARYKTLKELASKVGVEFVDASQPIDKVVENVLGHSQSN